MAHTNKNFVVKNGLEVGGDVIVTGSLTTAGMSMPAADGSTGQYLTTDGSGNLSWDTVVTSVTISDGTLTDPTSSGETITFVGGTGISTAVTDNTVTIDRVGAYTDADAIAAVEAHPHLTIDGGTLYVDTSNNYVGIGDTSPQFKLDVAGSIGVNSTEVITSSGVYTGTVADSAMTVGGSLVGPLSNLKVQYGTAYSGTPAQGSFFFDSLNQKLKVYTGSAFVDAVPAGSGSGGGEITDANTTFRKYTYITSSSTNAISGADVNTETLSYVTDGTENIEVYVNGIKQVEGSNYDYVATTGTSITFTYNLPSGSAVDIQVYEFLSNDAYYVKNEVYTKTETNTQIATGVSGYLPLTGGTLTGKLTLSDLGNATIAALQFGNSGLGISSIVTDQLNFITADTTKMVITASGSVGIGTDSPVNIDWNTGSKFLTIDATSSTGYGVLSLKGDRNSTGSSKAFQIGAGDGKLYLAYDDVNNAHRIVVFDDGDVGFGDDATAATGGNYGRNIHLHSGGTGASLKLTDISTGNQTDSGFELITTDLHGYVWNREVGNVVIGASNTERFRMVADGRSAFGMNTPGTNNVLTISNVGNGATYPAIALGSATTGSGNGEGLWLGMLETGRGYLWNYEADDLWFGTSGIDRLVIKSDGKVGIGTDSPQGIFHIESAGDIILGDPTGFGNANKTRIHSQYGGIQYDALQIRNETATIQGRGAGISFWGGSNASRIAGVVASTSDTNDLTKGILSLYATDYVNIDSTSAIRIARGTNSERPTSPSTGMIRFNTTSSSYEGWTGTEWTILSNTSSIVSTGLLANFQPNNISDGSTSWNDSTGNYAFSQLNIGSGSIVKDGADSWYGSVGAPGFKSAGDYPALNFGTGNFTLECWVYFSTTTYGTWKYILGKSTFWEVNSYGFYIDSSGTKVGFHWTSGNGIEVNLSGLGVGWHHLVAVGSGGNSIKFYIDGSLEGSSTPSYNLTTTSQISFNGDESNYHLTSNDRLGSARWYNTALTSEQVNQNRNAEIARY